MSNELRQYLTQANEVFIHQIKEWGEIFTGLETSNKYELVSKDGQQIGYMAEKTNGLFGFLLKQVFKSHRPLDISIWDNHRVLTLSLKRPFYFFFSTMNVFDGNDVLLGKVERRFGILYQKYDLVDARGILFGTIKAPIWSLWRFPIFDKTDREVGIVTKKWGGILTEIFTDSDKFGVQLPDWEIERKLVTLGCAVTIDLDFFEENHDRN